MLSWGDALERAGLCQWPTAIPPMVPVDVPEAVRVGIVEVAPVAIRAVVPVGMPVVAPVAIRAVVRVGMPVVGSCRDPVGNPGALVLSG